MKYSSNSVLAYTPQNKECELVIQQAMFFKEALGKRLFVLDIIRGSYMFPTFLQSKVTHDVHQKRHNELQACVKKTLKKEIPKDIILRIKRGNKVNTLIKESKKGGYDFIVIDKCAEKLPGALSRGEIDRFISKSHCPVLSINKNFSHSRIQKIIIPIDISQTTKKRLYWGTLFAKKLNAKIQIVSALNIDIKETKSLAYKNAEKLKDMLTARGVECNVKLLKVHQQERHKVLLQYIEEEEPGLVILRTHQEHQFSGRKIGKFVSEIVNNCKAPVFSVGGVTEAYPLDFK